MAANNADRSSICPTCLQTFSNFQGRRVHERSQHPLVFHDTEVAALRTDVKKVRWNPEELVMMAAFEASDPWAKNINVRIQAEVLPHRSIESIKGARKGDTYKALVRQTTSSPRRAASMPAPRSPPLPVPSIRSESPTSAQCNTYCWLSFHSFNIWEYCLRGPQPPPRHLKSEEEVHACM
ncbi:Retrovirus-related Pol polyprotein from type-2 retrotransposable element R2DM [Portunus trituberculatus]|uniref:Retrovirus-related Pol polyprotein from type-2 retrotransposable element R2DM n=1 Tax=Portunus trituberculatus TaxID=210409 RepID=A0A5B7EMX5_PORTR|nr:Retrovirus-related Pol polyprotein from type-2 retrotransposable element R2DM [Portunus trituberculatus]